MHDPLDVILGVELPHLFFIGIIIVDDLARVLGDVCEGSLKSVNAQLLVDRVGCCLLCLRAKHQDFVWNQIHFGHLIAAANDCSLDHCGASVSRLSRQRSKAKHLRANFARDFTQFFVKRQPLFKRSLGVA